ncbi:MULTISPECIES: amino acid permease [Microbacterium]|uniref:amino acid permease n=1 Tax=Microbacterium TaxID=33882 RepID=UPI001CBC3194|nr:amino acid permease [Microbacterium sp. OVT16B]
MSASSPTAAKAVTASIPVLKRGLKNRHIQMIALGGAIGTGLFYGSSEAIGMAGPSVLLAYIVGGAMIFLIVRALGEMSVDNPVSGAFSHYANENWSQRAGFVSGWNYWFNYIAVSMVELAVVGSFVNYWLPGVPTWASAAVFLVLITGINLIGVRTFGEFEFWFALVKVVAVIGMIVLGAIVIVFRINNSADLPDPSFAHLFDQGFFPFGLTGTLAVLVVVMFSFGGTELIGITAGEAENPRRTIPKAINQVIPRILIFYVGALAVVMAVVPWASLDGQTSPFVQIFDRIGIPGAAHILNLVVLTAVISVYNSGLYSNARMLYSLARQGNAPAYLRRISNSGVPVAGVLTSSAVTVIAVIVVFVWPDFAFRYLMSIATIAAIINWSMIMITQMKFRRRIGPEGVEKLEYRLPWARVTPWIVLAFLAAVVVLMALSPDYRTAVIAGPIWLGILLIGYEVKKRRARPAGDVQAQEAPSGGGWGADRS